MSFTVKFSYPNVSANDLTPTSFYLPFRLSGVTTIYGTHGINTAPAFDDQVSLHLNQDIRYTQGGRAMVEDYGGAKKRWQFTGHVWRYSAPAPDGAPHYYSPHQIDLADVELFITQYAVGAVNAFDWTDYDGTVRRVRSVNPGFEFGSFGRDEVWVRFLLEEA